MPGAGVKQITSAFRSLVWCGRSPEVFPHNIANGLVGFAKGLVPGVEADEIRGQHRTISFAALAP
jgi:hypothetical protein